MTAHQIFLFACLVISALNIWISFSNVRHAQRMIKYYTDKTRWMNDKSDKEEARKAIDDA